jgi:hypothetical protein
MNIITKKILLDEANNGRNAKVDRSNWVIGTAQKDIIQRGVLCLKKGEQVLLDPNSTKKNSQGRTTVSVYLAKNLGGVNTSRYASEFQIA